jgi:hypothetical protein
MTTKTIPVLVMHTAERVHVLPLGDKNDDGSYVVPESSYTYVGDVVSLRERYHPAKKTALRWYAHPIFGEQLGPFTNQNRAVDELLKKGGMYQAKPTDTMRPLF